MAGKTTLTDDQLAEIASQAVAAALKQVGASEADVARMTRNVKQKRPAGRPSETVARQRAEEDWPKAVEERTQIAMKALQKFESLVVANAVKGYEPPDKWDWFAKLEEAMARIKAALELNPMPQPGDLKPPKVHPSINPLGRLAQEHAPAEQES